MRLTAISGVLLALALVATPAAARRTAIDQQPDGSVLPFELGGYCDRNGDECDGTGLGYSVKLGAGDPVDKIFIHGNGILTFGRAIDFSEHPAGGTTSFNDIIFDGNNPSLASYGVNLISVGQNNALDFFSGNNFFQSAKLTFGPAGKITAEWFTCFTPTSETSCPSTDQQFLFLTPTIKGYSAVITSGNNPSDAGFVIDGAFTQQQPEQRFLIPAEFTGLDFPSAVPEPASWATLIAGFGLAGASLRRRRAATA
jgi:hypothetical protein